LRPLFTRPARRSSDDRPKNPSLKNKRFLVIYMTALFSAALILIVLSYFIQERNNRKLISEYEASAQLSDATLAQLRQEIADLEVSLSTAEAQLEKASDRAKEAESALTDSNDSLSDAQAELAQAQEDLAAAQRSQKALSLLVQLQVAHAAHDNAAARDIIAEFEETGLTDSLPDTYDSSIAEKSPLAIFNEIKESVK